MAFLPVGNQAPGASCFYMSRSSYSVHQHFGRCKRPLTVKNCSTCVSHDVNSIVLPRPFPLRPGTPQPVLMYGWQCSSRHLLTDRPLLLRLFKLLVSHPSVAGLQCMVRGIVRRQARRTGTQSLSSVPAIRHFFFNDLLRRRSMTDRASGFHHSRPSRAVAEPTCWSERGIQISDKQ
jgi:hypothetical protein